MVIVIFRSRLTPQAGDDYHAMADQVLAAARDMPGFVDYKHYSSDDGERLSVVWWENQETMKAWREHPLHKVAQTAGRGRWYQNYEIEIAETVRSSRFKRD